MLHSYIITHFWDTEPAYIETSKVLQKGKKRCLYEKEKKQIIYTSWKYITNIYKNGVAKAGIA